MVISIKIWRSCSPRTVLLAINVFASVAIFFEGYDQGVMGGVNGSADYQRVVDIGSGDGTVSQPTKQGGLVAVYCKSYLRVQSHELTAVRPGSIIVSLRESCQVPDPG